MVESLLWPEVDYPVPFLHYQYTTLAIPTLHVPVRKKERKDFEEYSLGTSDDRYLRVELTGQS
jgi:hypothetical protein